MRTDAHACQNKKMRMSEEEISNAERAKMSRMASTSTSKTPSPPLFKKDGNRTLYILEVAKYVWRLIVERKLDLVTFVDQIGEDDYVLSALGLNPGALSTEEITRVVERVSITAHKYMLE
jgi:hypothetical protein